MTSPLDLASVRARFPSLAREVAGQPAVYLDGPGGSQVPLSVAEAMTGYLLGSNANEGGAFATSQETSATIVAARVAAADLVGGTPDETAFGANMTTLNFALAHAVARTLAPGDEIVVTEIDHDANVAPWLMVAADHGLVIRQAPLRAEDGTLDLDRLEALLSARTRVVAFSLASNALGSLTDAARISASAHRVGALSWADAVHFAPHRRIDRDALGLDVLLCSPYKFFGPHQGIALVRRDLAESWPADRVRPASQTPPGHRFETGTQSHEALAGTIAAIDYLASLGGGSGDRRARLDSAFDAITAYETELTQTTLERLAAMERVTLHGIAEPDRAGERTATFCISVHGRDPRSVASELGRQGIFTWDGNYYALGPMRALGLDPDVGALRAGYLHYTTAEEAKRFLDALETIAG